MLNILFQGSSNYSLYKKVAQPTDIRIVDFSLQLIPVQTRMPLKFGTEVLSSVTCARVCVIVENNLGQKVEGWGETPLSVQWVWPSEIAYAERHDTLIEFCKLIAKRWNGFDRVGHCLEIGHEMIMNDLPCRIERF